MADIICGGLIGIGLVLLSPLMSSTNPDKAEYICALAFAVSIPLLSGRLLFNFMTKRHGMDIKILNLYFLGSTASVIGVGASFWHISWVAGLTFLVSSIIASIAFAVNITSF